MGNENYNGIESKIKEEVIKILKKIEIREKLSEQERAIEDEIHEIHGNIARLYREKESKDSGNICSYKIELQKENSIMKGIITRKKQKCVECNGLDKNCSEYIPQREMEKYEIRNK